MDECKDLIANVLTGGIVGAILLIAIYIRDKKR